MFSFHSSKEEKNKLLNLLAQHGIETTVDRIAKKKRIKDWIHTSVISEESGDGANEVEEDSLTTPSSFVPVGTKSYQPNNHKKYIDLRTGMILSEIPQENREYQNCREPFFINIPVPAKKNCCKHPKFRVYKEEKNVKETNCVSEVVTKPKVMKCAILQCPKEPAPRKPQNKQPAATQTKKSQLSESILKVKERKGKKTNTNRRVNIITSADSPIFTKQIIVSTRALPELKFDDSEDEEVECTCHCQAVDENNDFDSDSLPASSSFAHKVENVRKTNNSTQYDIKHIKVYKKFNH